MTATALTGRPGWNAGQTFPAEVLTPAEVKSLIQACSATSSLGIRNRALIAVLYRGGLRISEALALKPKDVDIGAGSVRVLHAKGDQANRRKGGEGRARTIGLDPGATATLARWMERRTRLGLTGRHPLFCDLSGKGIGAPAVRMLLKRLAARAGVDKRVHPHGLRHTMAAELDREGISMRVIQQQLGHVNLAVTGRYLASIGAPEVVAALRQREWSPDD